MPVYNTGEILRTAIDSILSQSFQDFELLLIDDGSTDGSPKICDEYAAVDKRVRCFHKQNGGICDARNYGMERSQGEYIGFCDHDDEYLPTYLETVDRAISEYGADMIKVGFKYVKGSNKNNGKDINKSKVVEVHDKSSLTCNLLRLVTINAFDVVWDCFFLKKIIISNNVTFDTSFQHGGEDADFNLHVIPYVECAVLLPQCLYVHYVRLGLSTSAKAHEDVWHSFYKQILSVNNYFNKIDPTNSSLDKNYYALFYMQGVISFFSYAIKLGKKYNECKPYFDKYRKAYLLKDELKSHRHVSIPASNLSKGKRLGFQLMHFLFINQYYRLMYTMFAWKMK